VPFAAAGVDIQIKIDHYARDISLFRELSANNRTEWMQANRERYQNAGAAVGGLCEELAPAVLRLDPRFEASGRTGANLSRIKSESALLKTNRPIARRCI